MARATSNALKLREGIAPVRDRLMTTVFLAGLLHAIIILGLTFEAAVAGGKFAPGLQVLLVSDELQEAPENPSATYLAQRTQLGSGNTDEHTAPRNRASELAVSPHEGSPDGHTLGPRGDEAAGESERVLATSARGPDILLLTNPGDSGASPTDPLLIEQRQVEQPGPEDEIGPVQLRGPREDDRWITPHTRVATLAPYLDAWRRKVERIGTLNYPTAARHQGTEASPEIGRAHV